MGSFSKSLYPGLKLGYLVVPRALVADFTQGHYDLNRPGQLPLQAALAEFIEMGHFAKALHDLRSTYAARRAALVKALAPCLDAEVSIGGAEQGLHLCINLPDRVDDIAVARALANLGLTVRPLSAYCLGHSPRKGMVVGFGYAPLLEIVRYGPLLARALTSSLRKGRARPTA